MRKAGVDHPERLRALAPRRTTSRGLSGGAGDQHAERLRARGTATALLAGRAAAVSASRRIHSSGSGGTCGAGGPEAMPSRVQLVEQRLRPRRREVDAEPEAEGEQVAHGDRPVAGTVSPSSGPRGSTSTRRSASSGSRASTGWSSAQAALLDEDQGGDHDDRLGHRRDPEDRVTLNGRSFATGQLASEPNVDVVVASGKPDDPADGVGAPRELPSRRPAAEAGPDQIHSWALLTKRPPTTHRACRDRSHQCPVPAETDRRGGGTLALPFDNRGLGQRHILFAAAGGQCRLCSGARAAIGPVGGTFAAAARWRQPDHFGSPGRRLAALSFLR